jgi:hypothetical protein
MGAFSLLKLNYQCPHCGHLGPHYAQFHLGRLNSDIYQIGDEVLWEGPGDWRQTFDRPLDGNAIDDGHVMCLKCGKPWWVRIVLKNNQIERAYETSMPLALQPPDDGEIY